MEQITVGYDEVLNALYPVLSMISGAGYSRLGYRSFIGAVNVATWCLYTIGLAYTSMPR